jgi:hypothetical protein
MGFRRRRMPCRICVFKIAEQTRRKERGLNENDVRSNSRGGDCRGGAKVAACFESSARE